MIVTRLTLYTALLILLNVIYLKAQDTLPPILHYDMRDGLSQMKTNSIIQDSLGYIWVGTRNGLNRFDGENITSYFTADGLPHDRIHDLAIDGKGHLLILTYKGISRFDGAIFKNYYADFLNAEYSLEIDAEGKVWILSYDETALFTGDTLFRYEDPKIESVVKDLNLNRSYFIASNAIYSFESEQFVKLSSGNFRDYQYSYYSNDPYLFTETVSGYRHLCVLQNGKKKCFSSEKEYLDFHPGTTFYNTSVNGSFEINGSDIQVRFGESPFIRIVDIFRDEKGNIWVTDENGFSVIQNSPFIHYDLKELPYVWTINQDRNNTYWAASFGYGLKKSETGRNFIREPTAEMITKTPHFLAASARGETGILYLGHSNGLLAYDGSQFENVIDRQPIYAVVCEEKGKSIYIGGIQGIQKINAQGEVKASLSTSDGLHNNEYIQNLSLDHQGYLWAGSYTGVSRISPDLKGCFNFTEENGKLPCAGVFCSYTDHDGITWMGGDNGLMWYDEPGDSIVHVNSSVLTSMVKSLTRFDKDHLLIGAKNGLYLFDRKRYLEKGESDFMVLNNSNGYQGLEPGFTGFYTDNTGDIWVCSASSVDVLKENDLSKLRSDLRPVITTINDRRVAFYEPDSTILLQRGAGTARITIDAVGIIRPQTVEFQYKLDDQDWSGWITDRQIVINELDHGMHTVKVRNGPTDLRPEWSAIDALTFQVDLPFYKRAAFPMIAFFTVMTLFLIALVMYYRQKRENKKYVQQLAASKFLRSQLLLSELNPHFIFNILSSIQHKVLMGDRDQAAGYVVKLSRMIRNFLTASHQSHRNLENYRENDITLEKELELLESYLEFEQMKSDNHFSYEINTDQDVIPSQTFIPPMLIQPFVENAIKHGLLLSPKGGKVTIDISYINDDLVVVVADTGIGRKKAAEIKGDRSGHVSLGTMIIDQRIDLLNQLGYRLKIKTGDIHPHGTRVMITLKE